MTWGSNPSHDEANCTHGTRLTLHCPDCERERRIKASNPKDAVGTGKVPFSTVPAPVMAAIGLAMLEGARKYGRHNYRAIGVRASVYYDAAFRHLTAWWEGQDMDPDTGTDEHPEGIFSHIDKALASLVVLRDAMMNDKWADDRPPPVAKQDWIAAMNEKAKEIIARYPDAKEPYTKENCATADARDPKIKEALREAIDAFLPSSGDGT